MEGWSVGVVVGDEGGLWSGGLGLRILVVLVLAVLGRSWSVCVKTGGWIAIFLIFLGLVFLIILVVI